MSKDNGGSSGPSVSKDIGGSSGPSVSNANGGSRDHHSEQGQKWI